MKNFEKNIRSLFYFSPPTPPTSPRHYKIFRKNKNLIEKLNLLAAFPQTLPSRMSRENWSLLSFEASAEATWFPTATRTKKRELRSHAQFQRRTSSREHLVAGMLKQMKLSIKSISQIIPQHKYTEREFRERGRALRAFGSVVDFLCRCFYRKRKVFSREMSFPSR